MKNISAKSMLLKITMTFVVPVFLFLVGMNIYSSYVYKNQLAQNNLGKITMYQSTLETAFSNVEHAISDMVANDYSFRGISYPTSDLNVWLYMYSLKQKMDLVVQTVSEVDAIYIMTLHSKMYRASYGTGVTYDEQESMKGYVRELLKEKEDQSITNWQICEIDGKNYFMEIKGGRGVYCVCLIDIADISPKDYTIPGGSYLTFATDEGFLSSRKELEELGVEFDRNNWSYLSGSADDYLIVHEYLDFLKCSMVQISPYNSAWENVTAPAILTMATLVFFILVLMGYRMLRKEFLRPLERMVVVMDEIARDGHQSDLNVNSRVEEYQKVEKTFHHMLQRISELRILAYDRMIQIQRTQLQYYQIQIRPHFYLNCMKSLYAMNEARNYGQMQEMILTMSDHLRSVFQDHAAIIPFEKELESVKSFVKLKEMSGGMPPILVKDIEKELLEFQIPPMSILTFVENSFRYAKNSEQTIKILVKAKKFRNGNDTVVNFTIMDNGEGFDNEVLQILNDPNRRLSEKHVGIYNVCQRFMLVYGDACSFVFSNTNGACVDIFIVESTGKGEIKEYEREEGMDSFGS